MMIQNKPKQVKVTQWETSLTNNTPSTAVCHLPMAPEPCTGQPPIWAFDSKNGLCVQYKKDFCQANANKFYTKAECDEYCGTVKDGERTCETGTETI